LSDGVPSSQGPVRTAPGHAADDGSAITGTPTSNGGAPGPAITTVGAAGSSGSGDATSRAAGTAVHGASPGRPAGHTTAPGALAAPVAGLPNAAPVVEPPPSATAPASSGVSGSANGRLRCTGPGGRPTAAATARPTAARVCAAVPPTAGASRTAAPNIPTCATVWLAPVPTSSDGRSAVSTSSGTPACDASSTAGSRFAAAVPDVVATGTGLPDANANPNARNPAVRSSMRTCSRSRPAASAACSANASGAL